jgi:hypothetical protein
VESAPEAQDAPEVSNAEVNWQERYENLEADHTRAAQETAQYRQLIEALQSDDAAVRNEALSVLGFETEEDESEDDDELTDPYDSRIERLERELEDFREQRQNTELQQAQYAHLDSAFDKLTAQEGRDFTDREIEVIGGLALTMPDENGMPDVEGAYKLASEFAALNAEKRAQSKQAAQVAAGKAAVKDIDLSDPQALHNASLAAAERALAEG